MTSCLRFSGQETASTQGPPVSAPSIAPATVTAQQTYIQQFPDMQQWTDLEYAGELWPVYDRDGKLYYTKILLRRDGMFAGYIDMLPDSDKPLRFGYFPEPLTQFPNPATAEEALQIAYEFLLQYENVSIDPPFYCGYDPETWLILVKRDGVTIAEVRVKDDQVWVHNPPPPPPTPTPAP
ncbi:MAG: hypothetical protein ACP5J4_10165 [Anaerolineae bacterium]